MPKLNLSRFKMALRGDVLYDRDEVRNLLNPKKDWNLSVPNQTRLKMLKLQSERRNLEEIRDIQSED